MIAPTAIISTRWDEKARETKPNLIIIVTDAGLEAIGEPGSNNEAFATDLMERFGSSKGDQLQSVLDDLIESFERMPHGHGYGGTREIVNYVGSSKTRVDKIKDRLITQKVEKNLR